MDHKNMDDKLVDLTDRLLDGTLKKQDMNEMSKEEQVVLTLHQLITPNESVRPEFRQKLTYALNEEWDKAQKQQRTRRVTMIPFPLRSVQTLAAAFISAILGIGLLYGILDGNTNTQGSGDLGGTAKGSLEAILNAAPEIALTLIIIGLGTSLAWYVWTRTK